jgi:hypothetical protein
MSPAATSAPIPPSRQREKPGQSLKWIGKSMKRVEDPRLLTGQGRYIDDIDLPIKTQTLCANSLLPKLPPAITGTTLSRCAGTPSDNAMVQPT